MYPTTNLQFGMSGPEVTKLQKFLVSQGMAIPSGSTGYFGNETKAALTAWQQKTGVQAGSDFGYWGPKSIAAASGSTTSAPAPAPKPAPAPAPTPYVAPAPVYQAPAPTPQPAPPTGLQTMTGYKPIDKSILSQVTTNLGQGMQNDPNQVKALQQAMVNAGYMTAAQMATGPGTYGNYTKAAVAMWQQQNGIPTAGNAGFFGPVSMNFIKTGVASSPTAPYIDGSATRPNNTAINDPYAIPPTIISEEVGNSGIMSIPDEAVNMMVPKLQPGTPEYQAAIDKINTAYYDVLQQQMNAKTEQDQQAAQYSWDTLKKNIETGLNIKLSGNAFQAWDQVQGLKNQFGGQNLEGSGFEAEATDAYLRKIRTADANSRIGAKSDEEAKNMDYYTKFATPQQISALIASNPGQAQAWGLIPSNEVKNSMSFSAMKAKYPDMLDADIQAEIAKVLDENGNYRSDLYQKYMTGGSLGTSPGTETRKFDPVTGKVVGYTVTPTDYGVSDIAAARRQFLEGSIENQNDAAVADYNAKLAANSTNIKSSNPATDTVSGGPGGNRFGSTPPSPSTPAATSGTPTLSNPINAPVVVPKVLTTVPTPSSAPVVQKPWVSAPITTAPKTSTAPKTYGSLYDYYSANGGWNTWNSTRRAADAKAAGISGYAGTGTQNAALLKYLSSK